MQQFPRRNLKAHKVVARIALVCTGLLLYAFFLVGSVQTFTSTDTVNARQVYGATLPIPSTPTIQPMDDGYDQLPPSLKLFSMSTLIAMGVVHPHDAEPGPHGPATGSINSPDSYITWTPPFNISAHDGMYAQANEPAVGEHPTIREDALSGGNSYATGRLINRVEHTTGFNYYGG